MWTFIGSMFHLYMVRIYARTGCSVIPSFKIFIGINKVVRVFWIQILNKIIEIIRRRI